MDGGVFEDIRNMSIFDKIRDMNQLAESIAQLTRIADALERAYPLPVTQPATQPAKPDADSPQMYEATDDATYEFEVEDQIAWLKEEQPKIFEELRAKLDAMEPE